MRFAPSLPAGNYVAQGVLGGGRRPIAMKTDLPPLPAIRDEKIREQVFTHRSFYAKQTRLFEDHPGREGCYVNAPTRATHRF